MIWITALVFAAVLGITMVVGLRFVSASDQWGATREEVDMSLPGDHWLDGGAAVRARLTRATWIEASVEEVWPWLAQMGRGAGWYSYDRLDNGGRVSAWHMVSWIPEPRLGDATAIGYLRHLQSGHDLGWWLQGIDFLGARFRGSMYYRVSGRGDRCRLLTRFQADVEGKGARVVCWLFRCIDGFMARRQLRGLKDRAERPGLQGIDPESSESGARDQYQLYRVIYAGGETAGVRGRESAARWRRSALADGVIQPMAGEPVD